MHPWSIKNISLGLILLSVVGLSVASSAPAGFNGLRIEPPKQIHTGTLLDGQGQTTIFPIKTEKWQLVLFGYTNCPDVCPLSLQKTASLLKVLKQESDRLQVIFISIDSYRDAPEIMNAFTTKFDKRIIGLTGAPESLQAVVSDFNVLTRRFQGKTALAYTLEHSAFLYLLDPGGKLRMLYPISTEISAIAQDLHVLWQID